MLTRRVFLAGAGAAPAFISGLRAQQNDPAQQYLNAMGALYNALKHGHADPQGLRNRAVDTHLGYNAWLKQTGGFQEADANARAFDPYHRQPPTLAYSKQVSDSFQSEGIDMTWGESLRHGLQAGRTKWDGHHKLFLTAGAEKVAGFSVWSLQRAPLPPKPGHGLLGRRPVPRTPVAPASPIVRAAYSPQDWDQVGCPCYCPDGSQAWNNYGGGCPDVEPPPDDTSSNNVSYDVSAVYIDTVPTPDGAYIEPISAALYTVTTPAPVGGMAPGWESAYNRWSNNMVAQVTQALGQSVNCKIMMTGTITGTMLTSLRLLGCKAANNESRIKAVTCACAIVGIVGIAASSITYTWMCT